MKSILISGPCGDMVHTGYSQSIVENILYLVSNKYNCSIAYVPMLETYIHNGRIQVVKYAQKINATHIIWVDSDMSFPSHSFYQLLNHELDFVGVNYSTRRSPHRFTAANFNEYLNGFEPIPTTRRSYGLESVDGIGFGLCLTATSLFDKLEKPWFKYTYLEKEEEYRGEDYQFCMDIKSHANVYVDHDLSKEVSHIGKIGYNYKCPLIPDPNS